MLVKIGAKVNQPSRAEIYSCIGLSGAKLEQPLAQKNSVFFVSDSSKKLEFLARGCSILV